MSCQLSTINYQIMIKHIFKIIWAQRKEQRLDTGRVGYRDVRPLVYDG